MRPTKLIDEWQRTSSFGLERTQESRVLPVHVYGRGVRTVAQVEGSLLGDRIVVRSWTLSVQNQLAQTYTRLTICYFQKAIIPFSYPSIRAIWLHKPYAIYFVVKYKYPHASEIWRRALSLFRPLRCIISASASRFQTGIRGLEGASGIVMRQYFGTGHTYLHEPAWVMIRVWARREGVGHKHIPRTPSARCKSKAVLLAMF